MITYVYQCTECEHEEEVEQRIMDDPLTICPKCGKKTYKRVIQPAGGFRIGGMGVTKPTTFPGH